MNNRLALIALGVSLAALAACSGSSGSSSDGSEPLGSVLVPSKDGVANEARPIIRWTAIPGAKTYRFEVFSDLDLTQTVDEQLVPGVTETRVSTDLNDQTIYYVRVSGENAAAELMGVLPISRFKTLILPDWMPHWKLVVNDPALSQKGYRLIDPLHMFPEKGKPRVPVLLLVNQAGEIVWFYRHPGEGRLMAPEVLPNGNLIFLASTDAKAGVVGSVGLEMTWKGKIVWQSRPGITPHHDIGIGPNGNYLSLIWEWQTIGGTTYEGDALELVDPKTNRVLWSWSIFDHFPPAQWPTPETAKGGLSGIGQDWSHANAATWDPKRSLIWVSVRHFDNLVGVHYPSGRVAVILGKGGFGGASLMSHQHAPEVQKDGSILIWDNGNGRVPPFTRAAQIRYDEQAETAEVMWSWRGNPDFYEGAVGDADRLPNGNTFMTAGRSGRLIEVTPGGKIVWELSYKDRTWWTYRALHVPTELIDPDILPFPEK